MRHSKLAVNTRTFPVLIYDPRKSVASFDRPSLKINRPLNCEHLFLTKSGFDPMAYTLKTTNQQKEVIIPVA